MFSFSLSLPTAHHLRLPILFAIYLLKKWNLWSVRFPTVWILLIVPHVLLFCLYSGFTGFIRLTFNFGWGKNTTWMILYSFSKRYKMSGWHTFCDISSHWCLLPTSIGKIFDSFPVFPNFNKIRVVSWESCKGNQISLYFCFNYELIYFNSLQLL